MKELEMRIISTFAKGMAYMEAEQAFFDARAKWIDTGKRLSEAMNEVDTICADVAIEAADGEAIANRLANAKFKASVAESAFLVSTREYEDAREKFHALPQDVLQAKADLAEAKYNLAMAEYLHYDREVCIAKILMSLGDEDKATWKLNNAYTGRNAAAQKMEMAKERCSVFEGIWRG